MIFVVRYFCSCPQFDEISEILARHQTLYSTMEDLMDQDQENQDAIDMEKAELVKFVEVSSCWTCSRHTSIV